MPNGQQSERSWITEGMVIALITASAYFWALRYETGWYEHFQIPAHLISLNLTNVLGVAGSINFVFANLIAPVLIILWMWNPSNRFMYRFSNEHPTAYFFLSTMSIIAPGLYITKTSKVLSYYWFWAFLSVSVLFYAAILLQPIIRKRWEGYIAPH